MKINASEKSYDEKLFKAFLIFVILVLGIAILLSIAPFANAQTDEYLETKVVSETIQSFQDPGIGHQTHQLAIILDATGDTLFNGTITFNATEPIQIVELEGPLYDFESSGPTIWTIDGTSFYNLNLVDLKQSSGNWTFFTNALALHTMNSEPFSVTYTVEYIEQQLGVVTQMENADVAEDVEEAKDVEIPTETNATEVIVDVEETEDIEEKKIILPPRQQVKSGISPNDVVCKDGLGLIFKATNNHPACVSPSTAKSLIERGWAVVA